NPFATGLANDAGQAFFEGLDDGYWLVYATVPADDTYAYETIPSLVFVKDGNAKTTAPKISRTTLPEKVTYTVQKVWKDGAPKDGVRPKSVDIAILKDGNEYEVVQLSDENSWKYEWTAPVSEGPFTVAERNIAEGYTVEITRDTTTFVVINSRDVPKTPTPDNPQKTNTPFAKTADGKSFVVGIALGASAVALLVWFIAYRYKKRANFGA
ncbi:MAG: Cna B-type domain-containing protein, partial [Eggerthellaceae bacterium]|nr:Cna B-type domain-containing protein [Eggerthellaceae bacterium]